MGAGWVNLLVLVAIVMIVTGVATVFYLAARQRGGRPRRGGGVAKPSRTAMRKVNPNTGDLFP